MKKLLLIALVATFTLGPATMARAQDKAKKRPNIVIILADDKDYNLCKTHVAHEKTWKIPSIFKNWRSAKSG
jgi:hypothetical protein